MVLLVLLDFECVFFRLGLDLVLEDFDLLLVSLLLSDDVDSDLEDLEDLELLLFPLLLDLPLVRLLSGFVMIYGFCLVLIINQIIFQTVSGFFVGFTVGHGGGGVEGEVLTGGGCSVVVVRAVVVVEGSEVVVDISVVVATV